MRAQPIRSRAFPGAVEAAAEAEVWIAGEAAALGLAEESAFAINLCVEELFLNAVKHGDAGKANISLWTEPDGARLEFVDDGRAFDPTTAPAKRLSGPGTDFEIGGFGAGLMQQFARRMTYRREQGLNRVLLEFDAAPARKRGAAAAPAG